MTLDILGFEGRSGDDEEDLKKWPSMVPAAKGPGRKGTRRKSLLREGALIKGC